MKKAIPAMVMACLMLVTIFITISVNAAYDSVQQEVPLNAIKIEDNENPLNDGNTIIVDDDGPADYNNIQDAINAAIDGNTVYVKSGIYTDCVYISKSITLTGEDKDSTIIDGKYHSIRNSVVFIDEAHGVEISNFTITDEIGNRETGLYISRSDNVNVSDNIITNIGKKSPYVDGIRSLSSDNNIIRDNIIKNIECKGSLIGITLSGYDCIVEGNTIENIISSDFDCGSIGIMLNDEVNTLIIGNTIENIEGHTAYGMRSPFGLDQSCSIIGNTITDIAGTFSAAGIELKSRSNIVISNNVIEDISVEPGLLIIAARGILILDFNNIEITDNIINKNTGGIILSGPFESMHGNISGNTISNTSSGKNEWEGYGIYLEEATYLNIENNIFKDNHKDASFGFVHCLKENESFTGKIPKSYDDIRDQKDLSNIWDGNSWDEQLPLKRKTITGKLEVVKSGWPTGTVNLYNYDENPKVKSYNHENNQNNQEYSNNLFRMILTKLFTPRTTNSGFNLINAIFGKLLNLNLR